MSDSFIVRLSIFNSLEKIFAFKEKNEVCYVELLFP